MHSDDHLAVALKEAGLVTAAPPGAASLVARLSAELDRQRFGRYDLRVVHRLDRETSGLVVVARTPAVAAALAKQFAAHSVERAYTAVVCGVLAEASGTLRGAIEGKRAVTHYQVVAAGPDWTTVAVRLETGRKNQIRRHFAAAGAPVVGDLRHGGPAAAHAAWPHQRIALHAGVLGFTHPVTKERQRFEAALPAEFSVFCGRAE